MNSLSSYQIRLLHLSVQEIKFHTIALSIEIFPHLKEIPSCFFEKNSIINMAGFFNEGKEIIFRNLTHQPKTKHMTIAKSEAQTYYSTEVLQEFKNIIQERYNVAKAEFESASEQLADYNNNRDVNFKLFELDNEELLTELTTSMTRQLKLMRSLENALSRIANGTYGVCSVTGKLIPVERLRAIPYTTVCREAA